MSKKAKTRQRQLKDQYTELKDQYTELKDQYTELEDETEWYISERISIRRQLDSANNQVAYWKKISDSFRENYIELDRKQAKLAMIIHRMSHTARDQAPTIDGVAIMCPNCLVRTIRPVTDEELKSPGLCRFIESDVSLCRCDGKSKILVCDGCGWFDSISGMKTWQKWYKKMYRLLRFIDKQLLTAGPHRERIDP